MALRGLAAFLNKLRRSAWEHFLNSMCATAASRGRWWQLCNDTVSGMSEKKFKKQNDKQ